MGEGNFSNPSKKRKTPFLKKEKVADIEVKRSLDFKGCKVPDQKYMNLKTHPKKVKYDQIISKKARCTHQQHLGLKNLGNTCYIN